MARLPIEEALARIPRRSEPRPEFAASLLAALSRELEEAPVEEEARPPELPPRRRARIWFGPRLRLVRVGVAAALAAIAATLVMILPKQPSAFAVLERARDRFERLPFHATVRNVFGEFVGDDTLVVEHRFKSATQWRSTVKSSSNPRTPEEAGDFTVFDGTREGRYEVEENTFYFRPASEVGDPYGASGANERDPTEGYWPSATGLKQTPQFLDENCRVSEDRVAGRAADKLTCDTGGDPLGTVGIWLDRETGFMLKVETPEVVREVMSIDYDPAFPTGIFDVVAPEGARLRGDVPGRPSAGEAKASITLGDHVTAVQTGLGAVWAMSLDDAPPPSGTPGPGRATPGDQPPARLHRIDPATNRVVTTITLDRVEEGNPGSFAVGEGFVWLLFAPRGDAHAHSLRRIDPATNEFTGSPIALERDARGLGVGEGAVWVTAATHADPPERGELMRIDPSTSAITRVPVDGVPFGAPVFGAGSAWIATQAFDPADPNGPPINRVYRVNARTNEVEVMFRPARFPGLAFGEDALWMLSGDQRRSTLTRIDLQTNRAVATIDLPPGANTLTGGFVVGGGYVWVLNGDDGTLTKIDAATNRVAGASIRVGRGAQEVAVGEGAAWVGNYATGNVSRIDLD
jgi:DNA-binding beta-propeller fold protein YncE